MSWTFRIVAIVVALTLVAGIAVALKPQPLNVEIAHVKRAPLAMKIVDDGRARIREHYTVSAPVSGTLARIELTAGDEVKAGDVLARLLPLATPLLDPQARKAAQQRVAAAVDTAAQAKATVERLSLARDQATRDLARDKALAKQGALPPAHLEQASVDVRAREAELSSALFAARVAHHDIAEARAALARYQPGAGKSDQFDVTSPVQGEVLRVLRKSAGVVSAGTPLLEVGDPRALELVADVLSEDAVAIRPGMHARVLHWGGPQPLTATVRRVEPAAFTKTSALGVDEQRVNVLLDLDGPPSSWRGLGDDFSVEIELTTWSKKDVVQLPTSALYRYGDQWSVFVVQGGRAHSRHVKVGHRGPLQAEILSGVQPGDVVIIHPGAAVRDGTRVVHRW